MRRNVRSVVSLAVIAILSACARGQVDDPDSGIARDGGVRNEGGNVSDVRASDTTSMGPDVVVTVDDVPRIDTRDCVDLDGDGYGVGTGCMGPDCNDNDRSAHPGAAELCDAVDNDCNAMIDEGFNVGMACMSGMGGCMRTGMIVCGTDRMSASCNAMAVMPMPEVCNGVDDDCDGVIDNGSMAMACYSGPAGTMGVGICHAGTQMCTAGAPGPCTGQVGPAAAEICGNAMDDNCNGMADEGCPAGPANDTRAGAISLSLTAAESTVMGTTAGASHDGPTVACGCSGGPDVWYRFTLAAPEAVYFDTSGVAGVDTSLIITDSTGAPVPAQTANGNTNPGLCNDDAGCAAGDRWSRTWGDFAAGAYYVVVGGCSSGVFPLHVQHVAHSVGSYFYGTRLTGDATTATSLVGRTAALPTCGAALGASGEDVRWIVTCGATQFFSLCRSDCSGATCATYVRAVGTRNYDPVMYIRSAQTGTEVACNDDGGSMGGTNCQGTGGDTSGYGSRLNNVMVPRGLAAVFVDERLVDTSVNPGMSYTLRYTVR